MLTIKEIKTEREECDIEYERTESHASASNTERPTMS